MPQQYYNADGKLLQWSDELDEEERANRELLINQITEMVHTSILNSEDCMEIFEIMIKARRRNAAKN
jgi:hypothetical protein